MKRDYVREEEIRILIDNYRTCPILTLVELIGVSRKFWYDVRDSRVMPNREFLIRLVVHLDMYQEDASRLFMLNGYIFPWNTSDEEVFNQLKKKPQFPFDSKSSSDKPSLIA